MRNQFVFHKTAIDYFEDTARRLPNKMAIRDANTSLTYSQLRDTAANFGFALANGLGFRRHVPVVLFIDKSCACVCAILGVLYSGNPYVPMDIGTPLHRLRIMLDRIGEYIIVADEKGKRQLDSIGFSGEIVSYEELAVDTVDSLVRDAALSELADCVVSTDLMYILFTSGSTGDPKGVAITHGALVDYIMAFCKEGLIGEDDILGNQAPFYADMSLRDLYMTFAVGATVCIIPQIYFTTPKKLLQYLDDNEVTTLIWVPTAYSLVSRFNGLDVVKPRGLRKIMFSGEEMPIPVFRYWKDYYPCATFIQLYGPTEGTGACTFHVLNDSDFVKSKIPIGRPFDNTGLVLLDESDALISEKCAGEPGEICIYGACLAAGYYNDPIKTLEVFVDNPLVRTHHSTMYRTGDIAKYDSNGNLVFISRKDFQVKHGGRRIELGEIEARIRNIPTIKMCCCIYNSEQDKIAALYVGDIAESEVRKVLIVELPQYMIPSVFTKLDELPRLDSGKLDRKGMKELVKW